ncbi:hypothetical protein Hanom_Chr03g00207891 [Helianthus anomalus]
MRAVRRLYNKICFVYQVFTENGQSFRCFWTIPTIKVSMFFFYQNSTIFNNNLIYINFRQVY